MLDGLLDGLLDDLLQDLRYGLRQLRNAPRFTVTVVFVLALGIGANTAVFSAIDAAFLRPLPFPSPDRLIALGVNTLSLPFEAMAGQPQYSPRLEDVRADSSVFADAGAYASGGLNLAGGAEPVRVNITYVTSGFFSTLERSPVLGRTPDAQAFAKGGPKTIVLGYGLWQRQFGGDRSVIGRVVSLNDISYAVTGVMPADFNFPSGVDLWIPLALPFGFDIMPAFRNYIPDQFIARLAPGVTAAQAAQHLAVIRRPYPITKQKLKGPLVQPLQATLVGDRRSALLVLMASAALLLLIACANVTNLLLVRASIRRREFAVRAVLGATRGRVLQQLLVESLLLALAAGIVSVAVAFVSLGALTAAMPPALVGIAPPRIDVRVLAFTLLLAAGTSVLFGVWPAAGASRPNLNDAMKAGAGASRRRSGGARGALAVAEVSIALILLIGAGLMLESLRSLLDVDTGIHAQQVVTARLTMADAKYPRAAKGRFLAAIVDRLSAAPGVDAAAAVSALPMEGVGGISIGISPEDALDDKSRAVMASYLMATPGYFKVMGVALRGADLPAFADTADPVAVINRAMAEKLWPHGDAVGRRFRFASHSRTVIGVVADMRTHTLEDPASEQMYFPMAEQPQSYASIVARGPASAFDIEARIRDAVRATDPSQPLYAIRSMNDVISASVGSQRTNTFLLTTFGLVALVLAGVGVYGVLSYGVTQRTREIGIRVALGAQRGDVVRLVVQQGVLLATVGIAAGLAGAYALSKTLSSILYQVSPHDVRVFAAAPLVLGITALMAVLLPALRATRVDAVTALRAE